MSIPIPYNMYVIRNKYKEYLGAKTLPKNKSVIITFSNIDHANLVCNRIAILKSSEVYYHHARPKELLLRKSKKNSEISSKDLEVIKENKDLFLTYAITNNISVSIVDKIEPLRNLQLRLHSSLILEPDLEISDHITMLNEQFEES